MSTRGTYGFVKEGRPGSGGAFVYIHYDNYPKGAAGYFYKALMNTSYGNFATRFIRANELAEITDRHTAHADIEYIYDVEGQGPRALLTAYKTNPDRTRQCFFTGILYQFINNQEYLQGVPDFKPFKEVQRPHKVDYSEIMNLPMAQRDLEDSLHHLKIWSGNRDKVRSANWDNCVRDIKMLIEAFPELSKYEAKLSKYEAKLST